MDTMRLKKMRQPLMVERLLERLVTQAGLVPGDAYQLRNPQALPPALQRVLIEKTSEERGWRCWRHNSRIWLFTAEMSLALSRERGAVVLMVRVSGEQGDLEGSGHWTVGQDGNWRRCLD